MIFTVIDIFMARSLRSLAGFCMGEYRDFGSERNIIITTLGNISNIYYRLFVAKIIIL